MEIGLPSADCNFDDRRRSPHRFRKMGSGKQSANRAKALVIRSGLTKLQEFISGAGRQSFNGLLVPVKRENGMNLCRRAPKDAAFVQTQEAVAVPPL